MTSLGVRLWSGRITRFSVFAQIVGGNVRFRVKIAHFLHVHAKTPTEVGASRLLFRLR